MYLIYFWVVLSAFLIFQIQPIAASYITPHFGGSTSVWLSSLLFFQIILLAGYLYSHAITNLFKRRTQILIHSSLVVLSVVFVVLRITHSTSFFSGEEYLSNAGSLQIVSVVGLLAVSVGLPYFLLSTTTILAQLKYFELFPDRNTYRLFSFSNAASLISLISFPFIFEIIIGRSVQLYIWIFFYILFCVIALLSLILKKNKSGNIVFGITSSDVASAHSKSDYSDVKNQDDGENESSAQGFENLFFWIVLSMLASSVFMSATIYLSQDIPSGPFLWLSPLVLYLLTFVISFSSIKFYRPALLLPLTLLILLITLVIVHYSSTELKFWFELGFILLSTFVLCLICHAELAERKPAENKLSLFYFVISLGGALGGFVVTVIVPLVLADYIEFTLSAILSIGFVMLSLFWRIEFSNKYSLKVKAGVSGLAFTVWVIAISILISSLAINSNEFYKNRNFYGILSVSNYIDEEQNTVTTLRHGRIKHGAQILDEEYSSLKTSYYCEQSGVARSFDHLLAEKGDKPLRVAVVGLGVGTLSAWGRKQDYYRYYEINPAVVDVAGLDDSAIFTYLRNSPAKTEIIIGDARSSLEKESEVTPGMFDLIVVDAFSSDSIPKHLLTLEALSLYQAHLADDGIIAYHVSNSYMNVDKVVNALAFGKSSYAYQFEYDSADFDSHGWCDTNVWVLLSEDEMTEFDKWLVRDTDKKLKGNFGISLMWTDNKGSMASALIF